MNLILQVRSTKLAYDTIASRMTEELNRYQKDRAAELCDLLKGLAVTQVSVGGSQEQVWMMDLGGVDEGSYNFSDINCPLTHDPIPFATTPPALRRSTLRRTPGPGAPCWAICRPSSSSSSGNSSFRNVIIV